MIATSTTTTTTTTASGSGPERRRLGILVAEENRTNRMLVLKILARAGHLVTAVDDGAQAVAALARDAFDVAVLADHMPAMSGVETAKLHRLAATGRPRLPIVLLTADVEALAAARYEEAGIDAWVKMPVEPRRLLDAVEEAVAKARAAAAPAAGDEVVQALPSRMPFRPDAPAALDRRTLEDLRVLGGAGFVAELVEGFLADAEAVLVALREAVAMGDVATFRDQLHALRSGAANIGAQEIYALCLAWRAIDEGEMRSRGMEHVERLALELDRDRDGLREHVLEITGAGRAHDAASEARQAG